MIQLLLTIFGLAKPTQYSTPPPTYYAICDMKTGTCQYHDRLTNKPFGEPWKLAGEKEWLEANLKQ